jgi:hypothetical protein
MNMAKKPQATDNDAIPDVNEPFEVTIAVTIQMEAFGQDTFTFIEDIRERAGASGEVTALLVSGIPDTIRLV